MSAMMALGGLVLLVVLGVVLWAALRPDDDEDE